MLQNMRKYTQGWVATTLGIILSLAFVMWGIENYVRGSSKKDLVAKVNGVEISANDLNDSYQRILLKFKAQAGEGFSLNPTMAQQLKTQLLNDMILQTALAQAAQKAGFFVSPVQTVTLIKQMPQFQENGQFSKERFGEIIARLNYNKQTFIIDVTQTLLLNQLVSGIVGSALVLPNELLQTVALLEQRRDISYIVIPRTKFNNKIPPQAVAQYYQQHQQQFYAPEKVQLEYIQLSVADLKQKAQISEQELNDYFSGMANKARDTKEISKAKEQIAQQKAEQEFVSLSDKLTDLTYTNPNTLADAANALGLQVLTTDYFAKAGGSSALTKNPKILNAVFVPEFIKGNVNSSLIETSPGTVVVVRIKNHQAAAPLPLAEVRSKIETKLAELEGAAQAKQKGEQLLSQIKVTEDLHKVAASNGFQLIEQKNIKRIQPGIDKNIIQSAFDLPPNSSKAVTGITKANGDFVLLAVTKITDLPANQVTPQQKANFSRIYADLYGKAEYELYVQSQLEQSKIKLSSTTK